MFRWPKGERGGGDGLIKVCVVVIIAALLYLAAYIGWNNRGNGPIPDHTRPAEATST